MKQILKNTTSLAVVKISGTNVTETISFGLDLTAPGQIQVDDPAVSIIFTQWNISSEVNDNITITRNSEMVLSLGQNTGKLDFGGFNGYPDAQHKLKDIVVTITGTGNAYITIRKLAGYMQTDGQIDGDVIGYQPLNMGWIQVF